VLCSPKVDNGGGGALGVVSEAAIRLLRDSPGPHPTGGCVERIDGAYVEVGHIDDDRPQVFRDHLAEFDGPLPVCSGVGVGEYVLGGVGRSQPRLQLLAGATGRGPVAGRLRGQCL
jgi:hypothetical protein